MGEIPHNKHYIKITDSSHKDTHCPLLYTIMPSLFIVVFKYINANKCLNYAENMLSMNKC